MKKDFLTQLRGYEQPITNLAVEDSLLYRKLLLMAVAHSTSTEAYMETLNIPYKFYEGDDDLESLKESLSAMYPKKKVRGFRRLKYPELYDAVENISIALGLTVTEVLWELGFEAVIPTEINEEVILAVMEVLYPNKVAHQISTKYPRLFRSFIQRGTERGITAGTYLDTLGYKATRRGSRPVLVINTSEEAVGDEGTKTAGGEAGRAYIWLEGDTRKARKVAEPKVRAVPLAEVHTAHTGDCCTPKEPQWTETSVMQELLVLYPNRVIQDEEKGYTELQPRLVQIAEINNASLNSLLAVWGFKLCAIETAADTINLLRELLNTYNRRVTPPIRKLPQHLQRKLEDLGTLTGMTASELLTLWNFKIRKK